MGLQTQEYRTLTSIPQSSGSVKKDGSARFLSKFIKNFTCAGLFFLPSTRFDFAGKKHPCVSPCWNFRYLFIEFRISPSFFTLDMRGGGEGEIHCLKYHYKSERKGRRGGRVRAGGKGERVEKDSRGCEGGRGGKAGRGESERRG